MPTQEKKGRKKHITSPKPHPAESGPNFLCRRPKNSLRRQQSAPSILKHIQRIEILRREQRHTRRQRAQLRLQTTRHILRRNLVYKTNEIASLCTEQIILNPHDARPTSAQPVEIVHFARIAAQKHGRHAIHSRKVVRDVRERQRREAIMPIVEDDFAGARGKGAPALLDAEEARDEVERGRADVAGEVWEEAEEEAGGAVEEDGLGAVVEVWVLGDGLLVALAHEGDHLRKAEGAADGLVHHVEEGGVEGEVVGLLEEEIAAGEGGVGFEFLTWALLGH